MMQSPLQKIGALRESCAKCYFCQGGLKLLLTTVFVGRRNSNPRPIVARFLYNSDLVMVGDMAYRLKGKAYSIQEQFPSSVEYRRKNYIRLQREPGKLDVKREWYETSFLLTASCMKNLTHHRQTLDLTEML